MIVANMNVKYWSIHYIYIYMIDDLWVMEVKWDKKLLIKFAEYFVRNL